MWNLLRSDVYRFLHTRSTQIVTLLYVLMLILLVSTTGVVSNTAYAKMCIRDRGHRRDEGTR